MTASANPAAPEVLIEVTGKLGEEQVAGLELYNRLSQSPGSWEEVRESWAGWFRDNPFGEGSFAVAKCEGRIVGFYTLIPTQMRIHDRVFIGGKGEFLVVLPEFRRTKMPSGEPLAVALISSLNRTVREFGMEATFAVPNAAAAICDFMAGARPMPVETIEHVTFFRRPQRRLHDDAIKNLALGTGVVVYSTLRRRITGFRGFRAEVEVADPKELAAGGAGPNLLVHESEEMLSFRFRGPRHWTYTVRGAGGATAHLVFTTFPEDVRLAHWTSLDLDADSWGALCREVSRRARRGGYSNLRIELPLGAPEVNFKKLGFVARRRKSKVFLHSPDQELMGATDLETWRLTNSHVGYY